MTLIKKKLVVASIILFSIYIDISNAGYIYFNNSSKFQVKFEAFEKSGEKIGERLLEAGINKHSAITTDVNFIIGAKKQFKEVKMCVTIHQNNPTSLTQALIFSYWFRTETKKRMHKDLSSVAKMFFIGDISKEFNIKVPYYVSDDTTIFVNKDNSIIIRTKIENKIDTSSID
ncbi:MAG: hypothetical protein HRT87_06140 [Legionellales bacterium]|nr:hypothetical protein [Legionellales bacterium]